MTETAITAGSLLKARKGTVSIVGVPEFGFAMVAGSGAPEDAGFAEALQALYAVSYGAHFMLKKEHGRGSEGHAPGGAVVGRRPRSAGHHGPCAGRPARWRWQAMIMQPDPVDAGTIAAALEQVRRKKPSPGLERLRYEGWAEGRCAQLLHLGPYASEGRSIALLHQGIAAAGYRPCGRHHEIYLGDPRRSAPEKLRTLLRHPVEPATA